MRLVLLLAWRHLTHRPGATLLSALGIGLGIAAVVSVLVIDHNTLLSQEALRDPSEAESDLLIQPLVGGAESYPALSAELRSQPFLNGVTTHAKQNWALVIEGQTRAGVEVLAVDEHAATELSAYAVAEGEDLDFVSQAGAPGRPELLMAPALAAELGLSVGSLVELTRPPPRRQPVTRCIDGEIVVIPPPRTEREALSTRYSFRVAGLLEPTRLGYAPQRVLISAQEGAQLFGRDFKPLFWANFDPSAMTLDAVRAELKGRYEVYAPERALVGQAPEEAAFRSGVRLCGFLALFLGLYIIFNTMSMSLVERVRQIGLLRALGVTRGRLLLIFLTEGLALALLGAALSVLLSERIVTLLQSLGITTLGFGKPLEIVEVPWSQVLAVMAAGVAFSLLGIVYPFLRASRLSVIDALRRGVIEMSRDPFTGTRRSILLGLLALVPVAWFIGAPGEGLVAEPLYRAFLLAVALVGGALALLLLFARLLPAAAAALLGLSQGPAATLARVTVSAARHRVFATVTGLMLVFAAIFLVVSVLESLKAETRDFARSALDRRLFVRLSPEGAVRLGELRANAPELQHLVPIDVEAYGPFTVRALADVHLEQGPLSADTQLRRRFSREPTLLLSKRCARDMGYAEGDLVPLVTPAVGLVDFEVLAVLDDYGFAPDDRVWGVVSAAMMKQYWCQDIEELGDLFVCWAPQVPLERLQQFETALRSRLGEEHVLAFRRGEDIAEESLAALDRDFAIFYAILVLTVLLAAVGVLNAMVIAVLERRREIGLLRAVGLTGAQVARMLLAESGVFGVLGGLAGLLLGLPLAIVATRTLTTVSDLPLSFQLTPSSLGLVLGGAVLVALLAVLYPALRANRLRLSSVMRYE
ncbi:MAG: FtsX-like permease family protein [Planctomycetota bacterium]